MSRINGMGTERECVEEKEDVPPLLKPGTLQQEKRLIDEEAVVVIMVRIVFSDVTLNMEYAWQKG